MIKDYIKLIRFRYHLTFVLVIAGAFISPAKPFSEIILALFVTYLSFNALLYGGLYTLNDIVDMEKDRQHSRKKYRPLPAGAISVRSAYFFAIVCMTSGLVISYLYFGIAIFHLYVSFIIINQLYTRVAKKIPYAEIVANALTHPMRFLLGAMIAGAIVSWVIMAAVFFLSVGFACIRRVIELEAGGAVSRPVLQYYSLAKLLWLQIISFVFMLAMLFMDYPRYWPWYLAMVGAYVVMVFGIYASARIKNFYQWAWLQ